MENSNWPDKIRAFRKEFDITQLALAQMMHTRQQVVSDWEIGEHKPSAVYVYLFSSYEEDFRTYLAKAKYDVGALHSYINARFMLDPKLVLGRAFSTGSADGNLRIKSKYD